MKDVAVGDGAFDAAWNVHADQALAREVLDEKVRARLMELRAKVPLVSVDMAQGTMSVILTQHGLAIRSPGEMSPELAITMRDLLLDMRRSMLAHRREVGRMDGNPRRRRCGASSCATDPTAPRTSIHTAAPRRGQSFGPSSPFSSSV